MQIQMAANEMTQMLQQMDTMDLKTCEGIVTKTEEVLQVAMKKVEGNYAGFKKIISTIMNSCQTLLDEFKSINVAEKTIKAVIVDLEKAQEALDAVMTETEANMKAKTSKLEKLMQVARPTLEQLQKGVKGNPILEEKAQKREAKRQRSAHPVEGVRSENRRNHLTI